jgi:hypothetical protein
MIGNEVINSMDAWQAAPCIKAYARDLKRYMRSNNQTKSNCRVLPLIYAAENSGIGAMIRPVDAMRLQTDYLTCRHKNNDQDTHQEDAMLLGGTTEDVDDAEDVDAQIDIFGVNIESWCSSLGTFLMDENGRESPYHELYQGMWNVSVPLVFSEMGCSHIHFDRDK